jgi:glutaredoxin 3
MAKVLMYLTASCPFCQSADRLLQQKGVAVEKIRVDLEPARRAEMMQKSGRRTVPQIWINGLHVGGCDDLYALERAATRPSLRPLMADQATATGSGEPAELQIEKVYVKDCRSVPTPARSCSAAAKPVQTTRAVRRGLLRCT